MRNTTSHMLDDLSMWDKLLREIHSLTPLRRQQYRRGSKVIYLNAQIASETMYLLKNLSSLFRKFKFSSEVQSVCRMFEFDAVVRGRARGMADDGLHARQSWQQLNKN